MKKNGIDARVERQLLSVPEVAVVLGTSVRFAWSLVYKRELGSVRVGKLRKVHKKALDRFIEERTIPAKRTN